MSQQDLQVRADLVVPESELDESASRSGGPGGQHVNKTSSRITLRWNLRDSQALSAWQRARLMDRLASRLTKDGELVLHVSSSRSQSANRLEARRRLVELLQEGLEVPRTRKPTRPSRAAKQRRITSKKKRSQAKQLRKKVRRDDG